MNYSCDSTVHNQQPGASQQIFTHDKSLLWSNGSSLSLQLGTVGVRKERWLNYANKNYKETTWRAQLQQEPLSVHSFLPWNPSPWKSRTHIKISVFQWQLGAKWTWMVSKRSTIYLEIQQLNYRFSKCTCQIKILSKIRLLLCGKACCPTSIPLTGGKFSIKLHELCESNTVYV